MIGLKTSRHFFIQSAVNQSWLACTRFPALRLGYMYFLCVLIGLLHCLSVCYDTRSKTVLYLIRTKLTYFHAELNQDLFSLLCLCLQDAHTPRINSLTRYIRSWFHSPSRHAMFSGRDFLFWVGDKKCTLKIFWQLRTVVFFHENPKWDQNLDFFFTSEYPQGAFYTSQVKCVNQSEENVYLLTLQKNFKSRVVGQNSQTPQGDRNLLQ